MKNDMHVAEECPGLKFKNTTPGYKPFVDSNVICEVCDALFTICAIRKSDILAKLFYVFA